MKPCQLNRMSDATDRSHSPSLHRWSVHYRSVHLHVAKHLQGIFCCAFLLLYLGSILTVSFDPRPALKAVESSITITAAWWNSMHHQKMKPDQKITFWHNPHIVHCTMYKLDFARICFIIAPGQRQPLMCPEIHNPTSPLPSYIVNEMWQCVILEVLFSCHFDFMWSKPMTPNFNSADVLPSFQQTLVPLGSLVSFLHHHELAPKGLLHWQDCVKKI